MSLFNTVGAGLNIRDHGSKVSEASFALAATELAIIGFLIINLRRLRKNTQKTKIKNLLKEVAN